MKRSIAMILATACLTTLSATGIAGVPTNPLDTVQREANEPPRGGDNERPGDRQRRGGRASIDTGAFDQLAREAGEPARGGDNERPGDRQRSGARG